MPPRDNRCCRCVRALLRDPTARDLASPLHLFGKLRAQMAAAGRSCICCLPSMPRSHNPVTPCAGVRRYTYKGGQTAAAAHGCVVRWQQREGLRGCKACYGRRRDVAARRGRLPQATLAAVRQAEQPMCAPPGRPGAAGASGCSLGCPPPAGAQLNACFSGLCGPARSQRLHSRNERAHPDHIWFL